MKLWIASKNTGKVREFRQMLGSELFDWDDLTTRPDIPAPAETGLTFRANAMLKASYYAKSLREHALADDSGLEVDALGGRPGVQSARWAELHDAGLGDQANNRLLIEQLRALAGGDWPIFTARFTCVLALADPAGRILLTTAASVEGRIIPEPRGQNGFGYDPLLLIDSLGRTTAELSSPEKHAVSHRGQALRRMRRLIAGWLAPAGAAAVQSRAEAT